MKPLYLYIGTGVLVFLLCLGFNAPASVLWHWQNKHMDPRIRAYGLEGTFFSGSARLLDIAGLQLNAMEWHLRPLALLVGRANHRIEAQTDAGTLQLVLSNRIIGPTTLSDVQGALPVNELAQAMHLPLPPLSGRVDIKLSDLGLKTTGVDTVQGIVDLNGLAWSLATPPIVLGSYHLDLSTEKHTVSITAADSSGPIELKGKAEITPSGTYSAEIRLRPRATAPANVASLVQQIGTPDSEGWYRIRREGAL